MRVSSGEKATEETELYEVGLRHCGKDNDRVIDRDFFYDHASRLGFLGDCSHSAQS